MKKLLLIFLSIVFIAGLDASASEKKEMKTKPLLTTIQPEQSNKETKMTLQQTLSIIKPDAVKDNNIGAIITLFEKGNLKVVGAKMLYLTKEQAQAFYAVHKARPFFEELVIYMTSGPVLVMALSGEDAIAKNREIMGATNPKDAAPGTIRALYGKSIDKNAVHGSDAPETAKTEIAFFFKPNEIFSR